MKILLLAGTGGARRIAERLAGDANIDLIASLSGATRHPLDLPCKMRVGGFGGADGLLQYLRDEEIEAVIDATHPFAIKITPAALKICRQLGLPHLHMLRDAWEAGRGDNWVFLDDESEVAGHAPIGATVFLATGRQTLHRFSNLKGRHTICRQIDPPDREFPFDNGEFLVGRPPFSVDDEEKLFKARAVDLLVVKNAGGILSYTKLEAARNLGIPVALIKRPPQPNCDRVNDVTLAVSWARNLAGEK